MNNKILEWLQLFGSASSPIREVTDFLEELSEFDLKDILSYLEAQRLDPEAIKSRYANLESGSKLDALLLIADLGLDVDLKKFLDRTSGAKAALLKEATKRVKDRARIDTKDIDGAILSELAGVDADLQSPWFPAVAFVRTGSLFGWGTATQKKLLRRLMNTLSYAAPLGGLQSFLASPSPKALASRTGLIRAAISHPRPKPVSGSLAQAIEKTTSAIRKVVAQRLGLNPTGKKKPDVAMILEFLGGTETDHLEPTPQKPPIEISDARALVEGIRNAASKGESLDKLRRDFDQMKEIPGPVIEDLGKELRFGKLKPKKILEHLWASIEKTRAQSMRR